MLWCSRLVPRWPCPSASENSLARSQRRLVPRGMHSTKATCRRRQSFLLQQDKPDLGRRPRVALTEASLCATRAHLKWSVPGSNRRPPPCKGGALPAELTPRSAPSVASRAASGSWHYEWSGARVGGALWGSPVALGGGRRRRVLGSWVLLDHWFFAHGRSWTPLLPGLRPRDAERPGALQGLLSVEYPPGAGVSRADLLREPTQPSTTSGEFEGSWLSAGSQCCCSCCSRGRLGTEWCSLRSCRSLAGALILSRFDLCRLRSWRPRLWRSCATGIFRWRSGSRSR